MRHLALLGHCAVAGALVGAGLAPLQLALWPQLHVGAARLPLALVAWSSWGALWGGLGLFVLCEGLVLVLSRRGGRVLSAGLWRYLAVAVTFILATVAWWNREAVKLLLDPRSLGALRVSGIVASTALLVFLALALRGSGLGPPPSARLATAVGGAPATGRRASA
jgi:hypothetical protein